MNLLKIWEIIKDVEYSVGKEKVETLKKNDSPELRKALKMAYDPYTAYYVKKLPTSPRGTKVPTIDDLEILLEKLSTREVTGKDAIDTIWEYANKITPESWDISSKIILKDLRCGISVATINKAYPNLIDTFDVMLAEEVKMSNKEELLRRFRDTSIYVEPKLDGVRMVAFREKNGVVIYSRNGKQIFGYEDLEEEIFRVFPENTVLDGELMSPEFEARVTLLKELIKEENYEKAEQVRNDDSIFQDIIKTVFRKTDKKSGRYYIFDCMTKEEFISGKTPILSKRKAKLKNLTKNPMFHIIRVETLPFYISSERDLDTLEEIYNSFYANGYEGMMIKKNVQYPKRRSYNLVKMKPSNTIDLEVIGIFEGEKGSKYEECMGGVTVEYKNNTVDIGSGWTDEDRVRYFHNPQLIIGKVIEIEYQRESLNKEGKYSLIFPRVRCVRDDKC